MRPRVTATRSRRRSGVASRDALRLLRCSLRGRPAGPPGPRTSSFAIGAEDFAKFTPSVLQAIAEANDADVAAANLVIVLARPGAGGEMFAECRYALTMRKPVYWTGRLTLSAWREGVTRFGSLEELLASVETLAGVVQP